jgi:hypothetical protein
MRKLLGGRANLDENMWTMSARSYRALTLRTFDTEHRAWSIFWLDARSPTTFGPPVVGGFDGAHGSFFGEDLLDGEVIRVRFDWLVETPHRCRWEQAFSFDCGGTWEPNWRMNFDRADRDELPRER